VVLLPILIVAVLVNIFLPETITLAWHVRHGFNTRWYDVEVHVPLRYFASEDRDSIMLLSTPGYVRAKLSRPHYAILSLSKSSAVHSDQDVEMGMARATASFAKNGYRLVQRRATTVAGRPLQCWELHTEHSEPLGPLFEVLCIGRGNELTANFTATPSMLADLYSTLESARPVSH
jgi:hypothetical protein